MDTRPIIDISPPVSPASGHFGGDTPFRVERPWRLVDGDSCSVSRVTTSTHIGAHADAPAHYLAGGPTIDQVDLEAYLGPCQLLRVPVDAELDADALRAAVDPVATPRVLYCGHRENRVDFPPAYPLLSIGAIRWAAEQGLRLLGTDAPSMDPADSQELPRHKALGEAGIAILENLALSHVEPGRYELIALPLRWEGLEAAPVRAVLRPLG